MKKLFSIVYEIILEEPGSFQFHLVQRVKERYLAKYAKFNITDEKILKAFKSKGMLHHLARLKFSALFYWLAEWSAERFPESEARDYTRTFRFYWLREKFQPTMSESDIAALLDHIGLLSPEQRLTFCDVVLKKKKISLKDKDLEIKLKWLGRRYLTEVVQKEETEELELLRDKVSEMVGSDFSGRKAKLGAKLIEWIGDEIKRLGLSQKGGLTSFREICNISIDYELWNQKIPDIVKQEKDRAKAKARILELMKDKAVHSEISRAAKGARSLDKGLGEFCLGLLEEDRKNWDKAVARFSKAVKSGLSYEMLLVEKAYCHYRSGEYLAAAKILVSLNKKALREQDTKFLVSLAEELPSDYHVVLWRLISKYDLTDKVSLDQLREIGESYLNAGKNKVSEKIFQRILDQDPNDSESYFHIARIRYQRGDMEGAREWIERMIQLKQNNHTAYFSAASLYLDLGNEQFALEYLAQCLKLEPNFEEGIDLLIELTEKRRNELLRFLRADPQSEPTRNPTRVLFREVLRTAEQAGIYLPQSTEGDGKSSGETYIKQVMDSMKSYLDLLKSDGANSDKIVYLEEFISLLDAYHETFRQIEIIIPRNKGKRLLLILAKELHGHGDYRSALNVLKRGETLLTQNPEWWWYLGLCEFGLGRHQAAEEAFEKSYELGYGEAMVWLGKLYARQKRVREAATILNKRLEDEKLEAQDKLFVARAFIDAGDFRAAQIICEKLDEELPDKHSLLPDVRITLGKALHYIGPAKKREAKTAFKSAVKALSPGPGRFLDVVLDVYRQTADPSYLQAGISALKPLLAKKNPRTFIHYAAGRLYYEMAGIKSKNVNARKGIEHLEKAVELETHHYLYFTYLGKLYKLVDDKQAAMKALQKAMEINPTDFESVLELAIHYHNSGSAKLAMKTFKNAAGVNPKACMPHLYLSRLHKGKNEWEDAVKEGLDALAGALSSDNNTEIDEAGRNLSDIFLTMEDSDSFTTVFLKQVSKTAFPERKAAAAYFLEQIPRLPRQSGYLDVGELVLPIEGTLEKLKSHVALINNIPKDLKKMTILSNQILKRTVEDLKSLTEKALKPLENFEAAPAAASDEDEAKIFYLSATDRKAFLEMRKRIELPKKKHDKLHELENQKKEGTFEYLVEYLVASDWNEKLLDFTVSRLVKSAPFETRLVFLKNLINTLTMRSRKGVDPRTSGKIAGLKEKLAELREWSNRLEKEWKNREDFKESLTEIPVLIQECFQEYEKIKNAIVNLTK